MNRRILAATVALAAVLGCQPALDLGSGAPPSAPMAGGVVAGTVHLPPGHQALEALLADAAGNPLPALQSARPDAAGRFQLAGAPVGRTLVVVVRVVDASGRPAELLTLARTADLGASVEVGAGSTLLAVLATESAGNELGELKASVFRQGAALMERGLAAGGTPAFGDRLAVLAHARGLAAKDPELAAAVAELRVLLGASPLAPASTTAATAPPSPAGSSGPVAASPPVSAVRPTPADIASRRPTSDRTTEPTAEPPANGCVGYALAKGVAPGTIFQGRYKGQDLPLAWGALPNEVAVTLAIKAAVAAPDGACFGARFPAAFAAYATAPTPTPPPTPTPAPTCPPDHEGTPPNCAPLTMLRGITLSSGQAGQTFEPGTVLTLTAQVSGPWDGEAQAVTWKVVDDKASIEPIDAKQAKLVVPAINTWPNRPTELRIHATMPRPNASPSFSSITIFAADAN